jgi:hypothetical protein
MEMLENEDKINLRDKRVELQIVVHCCPDKSSILPSENIHLNQAARSPE